jgi:uncharacterized protein YlxW (UPF0749 family)
MQRGEKVPPIDIEGVIKERKEAPRTRATPKRGTLSYVDGEKRPPVNLAQKSKKGSASKVKAAQERPSRWNLSSPSVRMLISILVSVALAAVMLAMFAPTKTKMDAQLSLLAGQTDKNTKTIDSIGVQVGTLNSRVENLINSISQYAKRTELPDLSGINSQLADINKSISDIKVRLTKLDGGK